MSSYLHFMRRALLLIAFLLPISLQAQSTEANLKASLLKKPLYLRGLWRDDKLKFDVAGNLIGRPDKITFTLAGVDIESVKLKPDRMQLSGHRVGILIDKDIPKRMPLDERIQIEILAPPSRDYTELLRAIFLDDLTELVPSMPFYWQTWAKQNILHIAPPPAPTGSVGPDEAMRIGGVVKAPVPLKMQDPSFSQAAHDLKVSGHVLVYLWVDKQGKPTHIHLIRPRGLGLDELSVAAVSAYQFKPATRDGQPVTVEMNVEVSFEVF